MDIQIINIYEENLKEEKFIEEKFIEEKLIEENLIKKKILHLNDYILFILFLFLAGFNIFFIESTKEINKELVLIHNNTNIPYDIFMIDTKYTIISLDVLFMLSVFILLFQVVLCKKCSIYFISLFVILYFLIPSIQIYFIINTINIINTKKYIISVIFYITSYIFYTLGLIVNFFRKKN